MSSQEQTHTIEGSIQDVSSSGSSNTLHERGPTTSAPSTTSTNINTATAASIAATTDICPFPEGTYDIKPDQITFEQKMWMVNQILSKRETAVTLSHKYGINRVLINKYVSRVKLRGGLCDKSRGRPRCLDDQAMTHLVQDIVNRLEAKARESLGDQITDIDAAPSSSSAPTPFKPLAAVLLSLSTMQEMDLAALIENEFHAAMTRRFPGQFMRDHSSGSIITNYHAKKGKNGKGKNNTATTIGDKDSAENRDVIVNQLGVNAPTAPTAPITGSDVITSVYDITTTSITNPSALLTTVIQGEQALAVEMGNVSHKMGLPHTTSIPTFTPPGDSSDSEIDGERGEGTQPVPLPTYPFDLPPSALAPAGMPKLSSRSRYRYKLKIMEEVMKSLSPVLQFAKSKTHSTERSNVTNNMDLDALRCQMKDAGDSRVLAVSDGTSGGGNVDGTEVDDESDSMVGGKRVGNDKLMKSKVKRVKVVRTLVPSVNGSSSDQQPDTVSVSFPSTEHS